MTAKSSSTRRPDPTVAKVSAPAASELEARVASLETLVRRAGIVPPSRSCRVCGTSEGLRPGHFAPRPGALTEIALLCPTHTTSSMPSRPSCSRSGS